MKRLNVGHLREPIKLVSQSLVDDGLGGFIEDGPEVQQEVFSSWIQMSASKKHYLGLDIDTNYFEVIIRSMDLLNVVYILKDEVKYKIQKREETQNLGGPEMLTLTVSEWQA